MSDVTMTDQTHDDADSNFLQGQLVTQPSTAGSDVFPSGLGSVHRLHHGNPTESFTTPLISNYLTEVSLLLEQKDMIKLALLAMYTGDFSRFSRGNSETQTMLYHLVQQFQVAYESPPYILSWYMLGGIYPQRLDSSPPQFINIVDYFNGNTRYLFELANKIHAAFDAARWCTETAKATDLDGFAEFLAYQKKLIARAQSALA